MHQYDHLMQHGVTHTIKSNKKRGKQQAKIVVEGQVEIRNLRMAYEYGYLSNNLPTIITIHQHLFDPMQLY